MTGLARLSDLAALLPEGVAVSGDGAEIAAAKGAYALLIRLEAPVDWRGVALAPGMYVYAGSACGPGGLRARLFRHFRREKALRWHVDRLTVAASLVEAVAVAGGDECEIVAQLLAAPGFGVAAPGFGASDCRRCPAHLLSWAPV